jgi:hypothetical protein
MKQTGVRQMSTLTFLTAVLHVATAEDEYKGYRIPAGSIVFANAWCVQIGSFV